MDNQEEAKRLAIVVIDYLSTQSSGSEDPWISHHLKLAVSLLESVYHFSPKDPLTEPDYALMEVMKRGLSLPEIYRCTKKSVKDRLFAESCKRAGNAAMLQGNYPLAELEYTKAIYFYEWDAIYFCNRAASRIQQGSYNNASADCNRALILDRQYAKAYARMGQASYMLGRREKAVECFRQAFSLEPRSPVCLNSSNGFEVSEDIIKLGNIKVNVNTENASRKNLRMENFGTESVSVSEKNVSKDNAIVQNISKANNREDNVSKKSDIKDNASLENASKSGDRNPFRRIGRNIRRIALSFKKQFGSRGRQRNEGQYSAVDLAVVRNCEPVD